MRFKCVCVCNAFCESFIKTISYLLFFRTLHRNSEWIKDINVKHRNC